MRFPRFARLAPLASPLRSSWPPVATRSRRRDRPPRPPLLPALLTPPAPPSPVTQRRTRPIQRTTPPRTRHRSRWCRTCRPSRPSRSRPARSPSSSSPISSKVRAIPLRRATPSSSTTSASAPRTAPSSTTATTVAAVPRHPRHRRASSPGWEQGLLGVKAGGQRQLDIPAELAYGDNPQGDVIQAGDALTLRGRRHRDRARHRPGRRTRRSPSKVPPTATTSLTEDLVVGDGAESRARPDSPTCTSSRSAATPASRSTSSWETGQPQADPVRRGRLAARHHRGHARHEGRRPPPDGDPVRRCVRPRAATTSSAFPADTDLVLVIDLVAVI